MARGGGSSRSFGSGGGRSFGGRSGGGGPQRGGFGGLGGNSAGGFGGGRGILPGGFRPPVILGGGSRAGGGCGCLSGAGILFFLILVLIVFGNLGGGNSGGSGSGGVTASTVRREALPKGSVNETGYYTDQLGWVRNQTVLTAGMKNFYEKTGVQPYLYLTDAINGSHDPTDEEVQQFAYAAYDRLFTDEAHFLLIFFEYQGRYHTWYLSGTQAKTVMDTEATDILLDYVDRYYGYGNLTEDEMFSRAFNDAGDRIMTVNRSPWIPLWIILSVLALVFLAYLWWNRSRQQKNTESERVEKILNTPLETFGSSEADDLAKKYED